MNTSIPFPVTRGVRLRHLPLLAVLLCVATSSLSWKARAADTVTAPLGEYRVPVPVGTSPWVYGLVTENKWRGTILAAEAIGPGVAGPREHSHLTIAATPQFAEPAFLTKPHYIEVLDGPWTGLALDIIAISSQMITVAGNCSNYYGFDLAGATIAIKEHATLSTMFPPGRSGMVPGSDMIMVVTTTDYTTYGPTRSERWFVDNGSNWEDIATLDPADDVVVSPGQGFMLHIGGSVGGPPRDVVFGSGPVCHTKTAPTFIPIQWSLSLMDLGGPLWPAEADGNGALKTVPVVDLGLQQSLVPWSDIALTFSSNGLLQDLGCYFSDGTGLVSALDYGADVTADRITKGAALYLVTNDSRYWRVPGLK